MLAAEVHPIPNLYCPTGQPPVQGLGPASWWAAAVVNAPWHCPLISLQGPWASPSRQAAAAGRQGPPYHINNADPGCPPQQEQHPHGPWSVMLGDHTKGWAGRYMGVQGHTEGSTAQHGRQLGHWGFSGTWLGASITQPMQGSLTAFSGEPGDWPLPPTMPEGRHCVDNHPQPGSQDGQASIKGTSWGGRRGWGVAKLGKVTPQPRSW